MKYRVLIIGLVVIFGIFQFVSTRNDHDASPLPHNNDSQNQHPSYWYKLANKSQKILNKFYSPGKRSAASSANKENDNRLSAPKSSVSVKKISGSNPLVVPYAASQNSMNNELPTNNPMANESTYIYISENIGNDIMRCILLVNSVSDCKVVLSNVRGPQDMVIINDNFFLVNYYQSTLVSCGLLDNGDVESCSQTQLPTSKLAYMIYSGYTIYITDLGLKKTVQCNLDYNFLVQNCAQVPPLVSPNLINSPYQLFKTAKYLGYTYAILYDANFINAVNKCVESQCSILHDPNLSVPNAIKILNNTAYLTDGNTNNLVSCVIDGNGNFAPCKILKGGLQIPVAIAFYSPKG